MQNPNSALPTPEDKRDAVQSMFDKISGRYDFLNRLLTFRLDTRWRKKVVKKMDLVPHALVTDLACGTGDFVKLLSSLDHRPIGIDLSFGMLDNSNASDLLIQGDLLELPVAPQSLDGAICGFALRNLTELEPFFKEVFRTLKPGGSLGILEVSEPKNKFAAAGHNFYFNKVVPAIGGLISDRSAYSYLPESVAYLPETSELVSLAKGVGFENVHSEALSMGIAQAIYATKPSK